LAGNEKGGSEEPPFRNRSLLRPQELDPPDLREPLRELLLPLELLPEPLLAPPPMRKRAVPHTGQVPFVAGRPFFIVTCSGSLISRLARHLTQ
jgi:hypothetical protein